MSSIGKTKRIAFFILFILFFWLKHWKGLKLGVKSRFLAYNKILSFWENYTFLKNSCFSNLFLLDVFVFGPKFGQGVIPYKSTEISLDFWPKKSEVFDIIVIKTFFKQNSGYFWPPLEFDKDLFFYYFILKVLEMRSSI